MGRILRGTVVERNGRWVVSVPKTRGHKGRTQASFDTEAMANRWRTDAIKALTAGQPVPSAERYRAGRVVLGATAPAAPPVQPKFREVCEDWLEATYVLDRKAKAERRKKVEAIVRIHLIPFFEERIELIADLTSEHVDEFKRHLAGRGTTPSGRSAAWPEGVTDDTLLSVKEAAAIVWRSKATVIKAFHHRKFPGATQSSRRVDPTQTRILIPAKDLLTAGFTIGTAAEPVAYSRKYAGDIAWTLRSITKYATARALIAVDPAKDLQVVAPSRQHMKRKPNVSHERPLELDECKRAFARLNIHHQLAAWLCRLLGLRISEAYGLIVSDVYERDGATLIAVQRQGGKWTIVEDPETGEEIRASTKNTTKTSNGRRDLVVAGPLASFVRTYIEAFHTDPDTGVVSGEARLIMSLRAGSGGGQGSFRCALQRAFVEEGLDFASTGFHTSPHFLRKCVGTELAFGGARNEVVRSAYLGHRPSAHDGGAPVTMASYTLRPEMFADFCSIADYLATKVETEVGSLITPTSFVALQAPSMKLDDDRVEWVRATLTEAGFIEELDGVGQLCTLADAQKIFRVSRTTIATWVRRGLLATVATTDRHGKPARLIPMDGINRRLEDLGCPLVDTSAPAGPGSVLAVAEAAGVTADAVANIIRRLGLETTRNPLTLAPTLSPEAIVAVQEELARLRRIDERSVRLAEAAKALGLGYSGTQWLYKHDRLDADPEATPSDGVFVLRASVARELEARSGKRRPRRRPTDALDPTEYVSVTEVMARTGLNYGAALGLRAQGVAWRRDRSLRFYAERSSFDAYLAAKAQERTGDR